LAHGPDAGLYLHNLRNPAADRFLAFLCDELHPAIAAMFRVDSTKLGLHGYSYGGLFATWVAMQRSIFTRVGASSPGILADTSEVLRRYDAELAADADHSGRSLHLTVYEKEITNSSCYNRLVGQGTVQLMSRLAERPLRGLQWSSRILGEESHATGGASSYFNFLRTCYPAQTPSGLLS
jgi:predicted alpha/beta superfamily hydrolase